MGKFTLIDIEKALKNSDFLLFTRPYSVNLGGIRSADNRSGMFNDQLYAFYYTDSGNIEGVIVNGTTDAGTYYRNNPLNKEGTAILQHDKQYRGCYQLQDPELDSSLRGHKGRKAFRQIKNMDYWRDNNFDNVLDFTGPTHNEIAYTNHHYMGVAGNYVGKWSAGCQGTPESHQNLIYSIADKQIEKGLGDKFSYTLFHEHTIERLIK
jgi:hypothetical protein